MKALCLWHASDEELAALKKAVPAGWEIIVPTGRYLSRYECKFSDLEKYAVDADVFIGFALPKGIIEIAENLKLLIWLHAGIDDLAQMGVIDLAKRRGFKIANASGANAVAVAEHAMMMLMALSKKILQKHQYALEGYKSFPAFGVDYRSAMLQGRTIGIFGIGAIGSRVAKFAKAFEMQVLGVRRNKEQADSSVDRMFGLDDMHRVLPQCDYIVLAMPNTPETSECFGEQEFSLIKPSAFLISVARAAVIQEQALYDALTEGRLRGYAADVWWKYEYGRAFPTSWGSRLRIQTLPNVLCSYDQASHADDVVERLIDYAAQSLAEFASGAQIQREVPLLQGY